MRLAKTTGLEEVKTTTPVHFQRESGIPFDIFMRSVLKRKKFYNSWPIPLEEILCSARWTADGKRKHTPFLFSSHTQPFLLEDMRLAGCGLTM